MYYRCPLQLITEETVVLLRLYKHYKNGYLPVAGGVLDQTPRFLLAMEIIESEVGPAGPCPLFGAGKGK